MTKHLARAEMSGHLERLGFEVDDTRAQLAPHLSSLNPRRVAEEAAGEVGSWKTGGSGTIVMTHLKERTELFTPLRVAGSPPVKSLTAIRITQGVFDNGQEFHRRDNWTARATAHLKLARPWTGTTTFILKALDGA